MPLSKDDKKFLKRLGMRLREIRHKKGWTLEKSEEYGDVDWKSIQRLESGRNNVTISVLRRVAKQYRISLSELLADLD